MPSEMSEGQCGNSLAATMLTISQSASSSERTYLKGSADVVTISESSSISSKSSGSLVLTTISSRIASTLASPSSGSRWRADGRRAFRGVREAVLLRRDEEVARPSSNLPPAELGRRDDAVDAGDASADELNELRGAVELILQARVDLLRFPMPLFCPDRAPRRFVPIMICGNRLPLERGHRRC